MAGRIKAAYRGAKTGAAGGAKRGLKTAPVSGVLTAGLIRGVAGKRLSPSPKGLAAIGGATAVGAYGGGIVGGALSGAVYGATHKHQVAAFHASRHGHTQGGMTP